MKRSFNFIQHCLTHPAFFDGVVIVLIEMLTHFVGGISTDEAFKYINPELRFWLIEILGSTAAGLVALNGYRNRRYAQTQPTDAQQRVITDIKQEQKVAEVKSEVTPVTAKAIAEAIISKTSNV